MILEVLKKVIKMSYLTKEEKKMSLDVKLFKLVSGLQTCKTKGEAKELFKEAYDMGIEDYKKGD